MRLFTLASRYDTAKSRHYCLTCATSVTNNNLLYTGRFHFVCVILRYSSLAVMSTITMAGTQNVKHD